MTANAIKLTETADMSPARVDLVTGALTAFMDNESDKGASEGLAFEIAKSLLKEIKEAGFLSFKNMPALKRALLAYCIEQEQNAIEDC